MNQNRGNEMAISIMVRCEQRRRSGVDGEGDHTWVEVSASDLPSGEQPDIRCLYCHGRVRVHRQHVPHGPRDHVEHISRQDSENCRGGHYFQGEHRFSTEPVT